MIKWSKRAVKSLKSLPHNLQKRVIDAVEKLPEGDVKPLHGKLKGLYRLRIGNWRVIFEFTDNGFLVHDVLHRQNVYK